MRTGDTPADARRAFQKQLGRHPHHHTRVAVPPADQPGARVARRRRHRHHRRGPRPRRHQARRAPRPHPRAARRPPRQAGAAHRPVRDRATGRRGRDVPCRRASRHGRAAARGQDHRASTVVVPVEDMTEPGTDTASIWPLVDERIAAPDRLATARRSSSPTHDGSPNGSPRVSTSSPSERAGEPTIVARAHHGSVSHEQRAITEEALKRGELPCVVATSSLELGIDMGAVDLVVQVESPPSVASGLQRIGRAGHQVGARSDGVMFPKHRGDLVASAVTAAADPVRCRSKRSRSPRNPLDVLAQQIVAMLAMDDWTVDELAGRRTPRSAVRGATRLRAARDARHARRPLPQRRVRRAPAPHRLGPHDRPRDRTARRATARGDQRRHDPRPRPVRRLPRRVGQPRRRARRGDGLRVASRRGLHPRLVNLAHRRHHPRPRASSPPRPGSPARCRSGTATRSAGRSSSVARMGDFVRELGQRRRRGGTRAAHRHRLRRLGRRQHAALPRRATRSDRPPARRPDHRRRTVPRRARRLAHRCALAVRRAGPRAVGPRPRLRAARADRASTCRSCTPTTASSSGCPTPTSRRPPTSRCSTRRHRGDRHPRARRLGAVRFAVPRVRCPRAAAADPLPRQADAAVAATATLRAAAVGRCASTASSRSCWRRCGSACRTSSTCLVWSTLMRDIAGRVGARRRCRDTASLRRTRGHCCSTTSARSCTKATSRLRNDGRPRSPSTRRCSPSCSAPPSFASCSTRTRSRRSRRSSHGSHPTGGSTTPRP